MTELNQILGKAIIMQFSYLHDCQVKTPVLLKEREGNFYLKHPVKPPESWKLNVLIRSLQFPAEFEVKLMKSPFGELEYWNTRLLSQVGQSEFAEIYQISRPDYQQIKENQRKNKRFFCLVRTKCFLKNQSEPIQSTCIDVSSSGGGLRFNQEVPVQVGDSISLKFQDYLEKVSVIRAKVVRKSADSVNNYISVGFVTMQESLKTMEEVIELVSQKNKQTKGTLTDNSWLAPKVKDTFSKFGRSFGNFFEF